MGIKTLLEVIVISADLVAVGFVAAIYIQDVMQRMARIESARAILEYRKRLAKANKGKNIRF